MISDEQEVATKKQTSQVATKSYILVMFPSRQNHKMLVTLGTH